LFDDWADRKEDGSCWSDGFPAALSTDFRDEASNRLLWTGPTFFDRVRSGFDVAQRSAMSDAG
jgi:hypothetical protein